MSHRDQALLKWRDGLGGELGENESKPAAALLDDSATDLPRSWDSGLSPPASFCSSVQRWQSWIRATR